MVALTSCLHGAQGGDCGCDEAEPSVYEHAIYAAPWRDKLQDGTLGTEYLPVSPISGRSISQGLAEAEYRTSRDSIPSQNGGGAGGMWDYDQPAHNHRQRREDQRAGNMAAEAVLVTRYITTHPNMPRRLVCAAVCYWEHSMSVAQVAKAIGVQRPTAWDYIKDVRRLVKSRSPRG